MSTTGDLPGLPGNELDGDDDEAFDELARRAGAALRRPAPEDGMRAIAARQRRQQALKAAVVGGAAVAALIGALVIVSNRDDSDSVPAVDSSPTSVPASTTPSPSSNPVDSSPATTSPAPSTTDVPFPNLETTFVSPRNGFSIKHPDGITITPATSNWDPGAETPHDGYDLLETGMSATLTGASMALPNEGFPNGTWGSVDEWFDELVSPVGCGVPRSQQEEITIDGQSGRITQCANRIEATVVAGGRLYGFTLSHTRSDARAVFDAFATTIDLTPETAAVDLPALETTFVSPTNGFSFKYLDRGGLTPATEIWDPVTQPGPDMSGAHDGPFDVVETGMAAVFKAASTTIPDGVTIDRWVDEYVSPAGCDVPRSQQDEVTIDGFVGRRTQCLDRIEATVVADGRLYYFELGNNRSDANAFFDAWVATIDLTPETAAVP
jgi:hypothetical protein